MNLPGIRPDHPDLVVGKLPMTGVGFATTSNAITHIVFLRAQIKMLRIGTGRIIAVMQNQ